MEILDNKYTAILADARGEIFGRYYADEMG